MPGEGLEFVLTLGTGAGSPNRFDNGRRSANPELSEHPGSATMMAYDLFFGNAALEMRRQ